MTRKKLLTLVLALLTLGHAAAAQSPLTIFGNATPQTPVDPDANAVTLGVKFWSSQPGTISGIRFYRGHTVGSSGYTVKLFSGSGTLLASAKTATDTCAVPCWEQVNFASPISIAANTTYVAAYYTGNGNYADDQYGLTNGETNGPLVAPASGVSGGNGVYVYSTGFPKQTWNGSNYYVDVSFTPTTRYLIMSFSPANPNMAATTPPGTTVATVNVTWSDGSPFTGTLGFAPPYSNDAATFALSGNSIIINPAGKGVSADRGTTQYITVQAMQ
jgi:Domain of unknown function (DUF4082)